MQRIDHYLTAMQTAERLYLSEKTRRAAIRTSMAFPVAVLPLILVGLIGFVNVFTLDTRNMPLTLASTLVVVGLLAGLTIVGLGLMRLRDIDYSVPGLSDEVGPYAAQGSATADDLIEEEENADLRELFETFAFISALNDLTTAYERGTERLTRLNNADLRKQYDAFQQLLLGAIFIGAAVAMAALEMAAIAFVWPN